MAVPISLCFTCPSCLYQEDIPIETIDPFDFTQMADTVICPSCDKEFKKTPIITEDHCYGVQLSPLY